MLKLASGIHFKLTLVIICALLLTGGCSASKSEGFAIYLTREDIPPAQMEALSHIDIAEQPVIALEDVITYNAQTHELKLTAGALERITRLEVSLRGKSFVVCVNRQPIYWGAFWTPISSISFDGVTIWQPLRPEEPYVVTLELGYPSASFYKGEDPRNNPEVMESLKQAGKLITRISIGTVEKLPHSMKGYELYSWHAENEWHFTLITGTDRNKTLTEIVTGEDFISETGWVQIRVAGSAAIKAVLSKLPRDELVFWLSGMREEQTQGSATIALPPGPVIEAIKEHAARGGLNFTVQAP